MGLRSYVSRLLASCLAQLEWYEFSPCTVRKWLRHVTLADGVPIWFQLHVFQLKTQPAEGNLEHRGQDGVDITSHSNRKRSCEAGGKRNVQGYRLDFSRNWIPCPTARPTICGDQACERQRTTTSLNLVWNPIFLWTKTRRWLYARWNPHNESVPSSSSASARTASLTVSIPRFQAQLTPHEKCGSTLAYMHSSSAGTQARKVQK